MGVAARADVGVLALSLKREPQHVGSEQQWESWSFMAGRMSNSNAVPRRRDPQGRRSCAAGRSEFEHALVPTDQLHDEGMGVIWCVWVNDRVVATRRITPHD